MGIAIVVFLTVLALGGAALAFAGGSSGRLPPAAARLGIVPGAAERARAGKEVGDRRKSIETALKEIDEKKTANKKATVRSRLDQAGFPDTPERKFWIVVLSIGFGLAALCLIDGQGLWVALAVGLAGGGGAPIWTLNYLKRRRERRFTSDFAAAIDVIVRSVKSGLPSHDALTVVAEEFKDPVGGEFKRITEGMKVGLTLADVLKRMYASMPTPEVGFFAIVMTMQAKSGGNLSEALGNLADVLRGRKRLEAKIKAMSSEAKSSAMIIGSLPPAVALILYLTSPNYIAGLFTAPIGRILLAGCAVWMSLGIFVMKKMINFKR